MKYMIWEMYRNFIHILYLYGLKLGRKLSQIWVGKRWSTENRKTTCSVLILLWPILLTGLGKGSSHPRYYRWHAPPITFEFMYFRPRFWSFVQLLTFVRAIFINWLLISSILFCKVFNQHFFGPNQLLNICTLLL